MLEQAPVEQTLIRACMREGHPLPPKIANAPELRLGLELYFSSYLDLMTCRMGSPDGPIPWSAVNDYAKVHGFDETQTEDLHYYVVRMDSVYLKFIRSKQSSANQGKK